MGSLLILIMPFAIFLGSAPKQRHAGRRSAIAADCSLLTPSILHQLAADSPQIQPLLRRLGAVKILPQPRATYPGHRIKTGIHCDEQY